MAAAWLLWSFTRFYIFLLISDVSRIIFDFFIIIIILVIPILFISFLTKLCHYSLFDNIFMNLLLFLISIVVDHKILQLFDILFKTQFIQGLIYIGLYYFPLFVLLAYVIWTNKNAWLEIVSDYQFQKIYTYIE